MAHFWAKNTTKKKHIDQGLIFVYLLIKYLRFNLFREKQV